jgi:hypothetical protein
LLFNGISPPNTGNGYGSPDATETYAIYDVETAVPPLMLGFGGVFTYHDLGSGASYGSVSASAADNGTFIEVELNASGVGST